MTRNRQSRGAGLVWWSLRGLACAAALQACSGDEDGDDRDGQQSGGASQSGTGAKGGGTGGTGDFGNAPDMSTGGTMRTTTPVKPGDLPADCTGDTQSAKQVDVAMYIMLDRSNSMLEMTGAGESKWDAIRAALTAFVSEPASEGLEVGLQYFPLGAPGKPESCMVDADCGMNDACLNRACLPPAFGNATFTQCLSDLDCPVTSPGCEPFGQCSLDATFACFDIGAGGCQDMGDCDEVQGECLLYSSCVPGDYAEPAVQIGALPGNSMALVDSLAASDTIGLTPTPPALDGALQLCSSYAAAFPTHRVIAVLATDGLPTECVPPNVTTVEAAVDVVADIAAGGLLQRPAIETYVIGVFVPEDTNALANLEKIALAGGTDKPFIVDASQDVNQQFLAALDAIRGGSLDCEFGLPEAPDGKQLDYKLVNVELTDTSGKRSLEYVGSPDKCADSELGWFYDADPLMGGTPTKISVCDSTCQVLRNAADASVEIRLGCASITPM
jgi:hypothetical protein